MSSHQPTAHGVLDAEPIARLRELGQALGNAVPRRILELYLGDSPTRLAALRSGVSAGSAREVERTAHALRGSSANLGAVAFAELCYDLEKASGGGLPADAEARLSELEAEYARVERAVREVMAEFA